MTQASSVHESPEGQAQALQKEIDHKLEQGTDTNQIFLWLVRDWGAFRAGLYAFVSPVIAVAIGVIYAHEPFGWQEASAMGIMLAATGLALASPCDRKCLKETYSIGRVQHLVV